MASPLFYFPFFEWTVFQVYSYQLFRTVSQAGYLQKKEE